MPNNDYVENGKKLTNSGYVIDKKDKSSGDWIVEYHDGTNTIKKTYNVVFEGDYKIYSFYLLNLLQYI